MNNQRIQIKKLEGTMDTIKSNLLTIVVSILTAAILGGAAWLNKVDNDLVLIKANQEHANEQIEESRRFAEEGMKRFTIALGKYTDKISTVSDTTIRISEQIKEVQRYQQQQRQWESKR